jgi:hypothetical protein
MSSKETIGIAPMSPATAATDTAMISSALLRAG